MVDFDGFCYEENECMIEYCDFCRLNPNGTERCVKCEKDYVLVLGTDIINRTNRCVKEESGVLEYCQEAREN